MIKIDRQYLLDSFLQIIKVPSPVGYYEQLNPMLEKMAGKLGYKVTYDNKRSAFIHIEGKNTDKNVVVCAHADTLGLMVRSIEGDGKLKIRKLGGACLANMENATVTVHTSEGKDYTGMLICQSHSVHAFPDTHTLERNEDTVRIILDEPVQSKADVLALGINVGDIVFVDPHTEYTKTGYLKSRFIDDKGGIACVFTMLKYLSDNNLKPDCNLTVALPYYEEIGMGATHIQTYSEATGCDCPAPCEMLAVDIGLIGPDLSGDERKVSICAKDAISPYDYQFTSRLVSLAKKTGCDYVTDVYFSYSSDANAALRAGNDFRIANIGMAVYCSHGRERTHIDGLVNTTKLITAYVLNI